MNNSQFAELELMLRLQYIISNLSNKNIESSIEQTMCFLDISHPTSFHTALCNLIYFHILSPNNEIDIYLNYLIQIQKNYNSIIDIFAMYISQIKSQEAYYIIEKMIELNLIDKSRTENIGSLYFAHYKTKNENQIKNYNDPFFRDFWDEYERLSSNNFALHKHYIKEGHNPYEIAKIIRNDEVEKLQEISAQTNFNFNQTIKPSLYERCSLINEGNVTLIDYSAFFGSVKCFKFLLSNGANVNNAGKYAVAGGNLEIIHLCEQNHSTFENAYETAIEFHQNDIFKYIYENELEKFNNFVDKFQIFIFEKQFFDQNLTQEQIFQQKNLIICVTFVLLVEIMK